MKVYSQKLTKSEAEHLVTNLWKYRKENLNPNIAYSFVYEGVTISLYKTNTVLFQGQNIDYVINLLLQKGNHHLTENLIDISVIKDKSVRLPNHIEIGCDEVGVGDYFGGLVTAAAIVQPEQVNLIREYAVNDSKLINDRKIISLYEDFIKDNVRFKYTSITAEEYNNLFDKYQNAHIIKTYLHNKTLNSLLHEYQLDSKNVEIILDQYVTPKNYWSYLEKINPENKVQINTFEIKAESKYLSVALASIIARYHFLSQIEQIRNAVKLPIFLGSSNPQVKIIAQKIYEKHGLMQLKKFVKMHFKTTKQVITGERKKKNSID